MDKVIAEQHPSRLEEREVTLRFHPWRIFKYGLQLLIVVGVFLAGFAFGKVSTDLGDILNTGESTAVGAAVQDVIGNTTAATAAADATHQGEAEPEATDTAAGNNDGSSEEGSGEGGAEDSAGQNTEQNTEEGTAAITTTYTDVMITLDDVSTRWYDTWGKITALTLTIDNGEEGSIKTDHLIMMVEGYDEYEKRIPYEKTFTGGKTYQAPVAVPNGFAYNEITTGDLTSVLVTLIVYDEDGRVIETIQKNANLQG